VTSLDNEILTLGQLASSAGDHNKAVAADRYRP
jgi:hypothetical protein